MRKAKAESVEGRPPKAPSQMGNSRFQNYLKVTRQKQTHNSWSEILRSSGSPVDRAVRAFHEGVRQEEQLRMKEQKARQHLLDTGEVDREYCEMVEAKLRVLDGLD